MGPAGIAVDERVTVRSPFKKEDEAGAAVDAGVINAHAMLANENPVKGTMILPDAVIVVSDVKPTVTITPVADATAFESVTAAPDKVPTGVMAGSEAVVVRSRSIPDSRKCTNK